jgi:hypothetical protein
MTDPTVEFFRRLAGCGYEPLVRDAKATVRFDLTRDDRTERWYLIMNSGELAVSTAGTHADCVIAADRSLFNGIASGEVNAMAAYLRGELIVAGEPDLLVLCQRLLPGPPLSPGRRPVMAEPGSVP